MHVIIIIYTNQEIQTYQEIHAAYTVLFYSDCEVANLASCITSILAFLPNYVFYALHNVIP